APRGDPQGSYRDDQRLFQPPEEPVQVGPVLGELIDGISHELAGTVERHVASALDLERLDTSLFEQAPRRERVLPGAAAECNNRRVLHQQQKVLIQGPGDAPRGERSLEVERLTVWHTADSDDAEVSTHPAAFLAARNANTAITMNRRT